MKKNNGFTLIETMGVLILLAVILILIIPNLTKWLKSADSEIDEATKKLILVAAEDYVAESDNVIFESSSYEYCLGLDELLEQGYISEEAVSNIVDQTITVKITYKDSKSKYELENDCSVKTN